MNKAVTITTYLGIATVVTLALITTIDVLGRYLFNSPLRGSYEISELIFCVIAASGIAAVTASDKHISVDSIFVRMSPFWQRVITIFSTSIAIAVFSVLCWQGVVAVRESMTPNYETTPGLASIVTFPFRIGLALGFMLSLIALVLKIVRTIRTKKLDGPKDQIQIL